MEGSPRGKLLKLTDITNTVVKDEERQITASNWPFKD